MFATLAVVFHAVGPIWSLSAGDGLFCHHLCSTVGDVVNTENFFFVGDEVHGIKGGKMPAHGSGGRRCGEIGSILA